MFTYKSNGLETHKQNPNKTNEQNPIKFMYYIRNEKNPNKMDYTSWLKILSKYVDDSYLCSDS